MEAMQMRMALSLFRRLAAAILISTFAISLLIEISIPGGLRSVVFPFGTPPAGSRTPRQQETVDLYSLDNNMVVRWLKWLGNALQGDLGESNERTGADVIGLMSPRFSISIQIMLFATVLAIAVGIPLGLLAALWRGRRAGLVLDIFIGLFQSVPTFITPLFFIWLFAIKLRWLPAIGWVRISDSITGNLKGLLLPVITLALVEMSYIARVIKSDVVATLQMDYITAAVAKGLRPTHVLFRHALRPASLGLLNVLGLSIGSLLGGAFVVEFIFAIGGLGRLFIDAMFTRDLHVALAATGYVVSVYVILNWLVDLLMYVVDPRIRRTR